MAQETTRLFSMDAGPYRDGVLRVVSFRGHEALSRPYRWDVVVDLEGADFEALEVDLIAQGASLDYSMNEAVPRVVHGVVSALRRVDASKDGQARRLKLRLVPRLAMLSRSRMSRIFQEMTVPEIVAEVLGDAGVTVIARLQQRYQPRVYCVQYQESDLAFVSRILAEEGIFYYFMQPPVMLSELGPAAAAAQALLAAAGVKQGVLSEVVVLADHAKAYPPIGSPIGVGALRAPALTYHLEDGGVPDEHHVSRFTRERVARPQAVLLRDYDFRHPRVDLAAAESAREVLPALSGQESLRSFSEVLGDRLRRTNRGTGLEGVTAVEVDPRHATVYEHHGEDDDPEVTRAAARTRFEQVRRAVTAASGASWCRRLSAGHRFVFTGHSDATLDGEYALTEVRHVGRTGSQRAARRAGGAYENSFSCVPSTVAFRPAPAPRVHRQVLETATVVGPPGEEIYTDNHGRIKAQFHWDLAASGDERSSCWLRVSQAWAGASWGAQFIPRVGMEVIVSFLGGDQDRPVVLGCLYNGENSPTFSVPGDRTRSGLRTQSSPGGGGFNELSFEDAKGSEQVYLHAQKNLDEVVRNDHSVLVQHDEAVRVDGDQTQWVTGAQRETVVGDQLLVVEGNRSETVRLNRAVHVRGGQTARVDGDDNVTVAGNADRFFIRDLTTRVAGSVRHEVTGASSESVSGDLTVQIRGHHTTTVGRHEAARSALLHVEGSSSFWSSQTTVLESQTDILFLCGKTMIRLTPERLELVSPEVIVRGGENCVTVGDDVVRVRAKSEAIIGADKVSVKSKDSAVQLDGDAQVMSTGKVKLLNGSLSLDSDSSESVKLTTIELKDQDGNPLPGQRFIIRLKDGSEQAGVLGPDGKATVELAESAKIRFPGLGGLRRA